MEIRAEVVIDAPAHNAWALIGDQFGEIGQWAAPIVHSSLDSPPGAGAVRTCQIASFGPFRAGSIKERLPQFDSMAMVGEGSVANWLSPPVRLGLQRSE